MSTRSRIGIEDPETGKIRSVYCHFDGYLGGVGQILVEHYKDRKKVERLIKLGDLSVLGAEIGKKVDFDTYRNTAAALADLPTQCVAYHRDRGDDHDIAEDDNAEAFVARATDGWEEFAYLYRQGVWFVREIGGDAGPFIVNANDPDGTQEKPWLNVEGALRFGTSDHRAYAIVTAA